MKCREFQFGDWCCNEYGLPMQMVDLGKDYAYATYEGDEGYPWLFSDNKDDHPHPIEITIELLKANGWKDAEFWCEYQDGNNTIQYCPPDMRGKINGIEIEHFKCEYVHEYQHLLRLCGLDELADNFKM